MNRIWRLPGLIVGVALAVFLGSTSAAAGTTNSAADNPLIAIGNVAPFALQGQVVLPQAADKSAQGPVMRGVTAQLPRDATEGVTLRVKDRSLTLGLPDATGVEAKVAPNGTVYYDNPNGTSVVPIFKADGALQILTVSTSASSPSRLEYNLSLPEGVTASPDGTGGYILQGPDGGVAGVITAPWALDATGASIQTQYEWDGQTLVQSIDLNAPGIVFPVVADPTIYIFWWGYGIKYTKAETAQIANSNPTAAAVLLCAFIPNYAARVICAASSTVIIGLYWSVFQSARDHGKCAQLNIPYTPPAPPLVYEVSC